MSSFLLNPSSASFKGYAANSWICPANGSLVAGNTLSVNQINAIAFTVLRPVYIGGLGGRVTAAVSGASVQFAVYPTIANGNLGAPLGYTSSLSAATATTVSDTAITPFLLLPGEVYWYATSVSTGTGVSMQSVSNAQPVLGALIGLSSLADLSVSSTTMQNHRVYIPVTFGTWPDLSTTAPATGQAAQNRGAPFLYIASLP